MFRISGFLHDAGVVLRREDQLGDARLDVGDDLRAVGRVLIGRLEALEVGLESLVGVGVHRECHARDAAFFNLFHGCRVVSEIQSLRMLPPLDFSSEVWQSPE